MNDPFQTSENITTPPKRQCWECLRRRLVCDFTLPSCKKCQKAGKTCPGYDPQKPLQWLAPGKVTSRRRNKGPASSKGKAKGNSAKAQKIVSPNEETALEIRPKSGFTSKSSGFAQADVIEEVEHVDADVEDVPRTAWRNGNSEDSQTLSQTSSATLSYVQELVDMPRFELTNETYDVVQAVHYCKSSLPILPLPHTLSK